VDISFKYTLIYYCGLLRNYEYHYVHSDPDSKHMGESRETRILEFHQENRPPVVGLCEGAWLIYENDRVRLANGEGVLFQRGIGRLTIEAPFDLTGYVLKPK
jgi:dipeptidase E